ncbi:MAG: hypothetical protein R3304_02875, partial [Longimicrobiales bacterium]|nr:hypothetical protein [Longimicrobiales bacterium]
HGQEQAQPLLHRVALLVAPSRDPDAVDALHDEIGPAIVRRSSVLFADRMGAVQLHHGTADAVVDVSQAQALIDAMSSLGRGAPDFQAHLYEGGTHNPLSLSNSIPRTVDFLAALR